MNFLEYSEIVSLIVLTCDSVILHKQRREFLSTKYEKKISEVQNLTNFFCLLWFRCVKPQSNFDKWRVTGFILFISLHIAVSDGLKVNYLVWTLYMITSKLPVCFAVNCFVCSCVREASDWTNIVSLLETYRDNIQKWPWKGNSSHKILWAPEFSS